MRWCKLSPFLFLVNLALTDIEGKTLEMVHLGEIEGRTLSVLEDIEVCFWSNSMLIYSCCLYPIWNTNLSPTIGTSFATPQHIICNNNNIKGWTNKKTYIIYIITCPFHGPMLWGIGSKGCFIVSIIIPREIINFKEDKKI